MDLARYADAPLTYSEVGGTRRTLPSGYHHVVIARQIGTGTAAFETAVKTIMTWDMHRGAGLTVDATTSQAQPGTIVVARLGIGRAAFVIPCRVVYIIDEPDRRGFAYGTLPGHPESGEELFIAELRPDNSVWVTITAFSRPGRWFTRLGGPANRVVQRVMTRRYIDAVANKL